MILSNLVADERYLEVLYIAHIICLIIISESVFIDVNRCTKTFDINSTFPGQHLLLLLSRKKVFGHLSTSKKTLSDKKIIKTIRGSEGTWKDLTFETNLVFVSLTV